MASSPVGGEVPHGGEVVPAREHVGVGVSRGAHETQGVDLRSVAIAGGAVLREHGVNRGLELLVMSACGSVFGSEPRIGGHAVRAASRSAAGGGVIALFSLAPPAIHALKV